MSENCIIEGLTEAVAIAKGERPAARIHVNGHAYIPEALEFRPPIPAPVWAEMVERGARAICRYEIAVYPTDLVEREKYMRGYVEEKWHDYTEQAEACLRAALGIDRDGGDELNDALSQVATELVARSKPMPADIAAIVNDRFDELLDRAAADAVHEPEERG